MESKNYCYEYPRPSVTTDCVVFTLDRKELKVLLIQRKDNPFKGKWAFPGGFMNMDETAMQGALRELREETGIEEIALEQFYTFSKVDRDPRGRTITIAHLAFTKNKENVVAGDDAENAAWFSILDLPPLAFDHDEVMQKAMDRLREKITIQPFGKELLPDSFTKDELLALYRTILGENFLQENFFGEMSGSGLLVKDSHGEDTVYRFNEKKYKELTERLLH